MSLWIMCGKDQKNNFFNWPDNLGNGEGRTNALVRSQHCARQSKINESESPLGAACVNSWQFLLCQRNSENSSGRSTSSKDLDRYRRDWGGCPLFGKDDQRKFEVKISGKTKTI